MLKLIKQKYPSGIQRQYIGAGCHFDLLNEFRLNWSNLTTQFLITKANFLSNLDSSSEEIAPLNDEITAT